MSAFVLDKPHIDALVLLGEADRLYRMHFKRANGQRVELNEQTADELGQMLIDTNVASVAYRYPNDELTDLPGPVNAWYVLPYKLPVGSTGPVRFGPQPPSPIQGLKLIDCYEYQSCEHPEWETSPAREYCDALRRALISRLPGYDAADWELVTA